MTVAYLGFHLGGGGGGQLIFGKVVVFVCQSHAFARELWGHAPRKLFEMVQFGVYFAAISLKKYIKMFIFYIKIIDILLRTIFGGNGAYRYTP